MPEVFNPTGYIVCPLRGKLRSQCAHFNACSFYVHTTDSEITTLIYIVGRSSLAGAMVVSQVYRLQ